MFSSSKRRLLLVNDEPQTCELMDLHFRDSGFDVFIASDVASARAYCHSGVPDAAIIDCGLQDGNGLELISHLKKLDGSIATFVLGGRGNGAADLAVRTVKEGAEQFLTKPVDLNLLTAQIAKVVDHRRVHRQQVANAATRARYRRDPFLGHSPAIRQLADEVRKIANSELPVLIQGETGTGKSVLAEWLHLNGPRAEEALIDINCAGLSKELLESELFGHEKGAFTGAVTAKPGLLELAHRGTAFLDEIGDMDLSVQPKLLRVVEEKSIRHVGGTRDRILDIRLIVATCRDLAAMVQDRTFRADLYFRFSTIPIHVPPLRSRAEDIPIIAELFVRHLRSELRRPELDLDRDAIVRIRSYSWPGNIRELRNVLERAALLTEDGVIRDKHLGFQPYAATLPVETPDLWRLTLDELEAIHIERALEHTAGDVAQAAADLAIAKSTLYAKLRHHKVRYGKRKREVAVS